MNSESPYNPDTIRKLIQAAFDDEGFCIFCFDYFPPVYKRFAAGQSKWRHVQLLVDHAEKQQRLDNLLALIQAANPVAHSAFQQQLTVIPPSSAPALSDLPPSSEAKAKYHSCFISYSNQDQDFAEQLHADLRSAGVQCWFAPEDMKIGAPIRPTLDQSVWEQSKLLLILSEYSIASDWVEQEVETAMEKERVRGELVLFPIRLGETIMAERIGWAAHIKRTRHIGDFSRWRDPSAYQQAFKRLLRDLKM